MIKTVHIISSLYTNGAEMMLLKLLSKMDKTKFSNVVISLTEKRKVGDLGCLIEDLGVPVYYLNMNRKSLSNILKILFVTKLIYKEKPQIIQTWLYHSDLLGLLIGKLLRVPNILWNIRSANMDLAHYHKLTTYVVRALAKLSRYPNAVIVNSNAGLKLHQERNYRPKRWEVISNGFDLKHFCPDPSQRIKLRKSLGLDENTILIGNVARFDPMKDHSTFLKAVKLLLETFPEAHAVLIGRKVSNETPFFKEMVKELLIRDNVHLLGERRDINHLLSALDIFSLSSSSEGFPNVIGEAMACGVPCVVTDVGDSAIIVGDTGRLVPAKDPKALAEAWGDLIRRGPEYRQNLGQEARKRIEINYDLPHIVGKYEKLYEELANGARY